MTKLLPTSGFVQLGLDGSTIIGCAYPGFGFGGRNAAGLLLVNFNFIFSIGQRFRAGRYKISHLQQYLPGYVPF
jgi:hypothetical protein